MIDLDKPPSPKAGLWILITCIVLFSVPLFFKSETTVKPKPKVSLEATQIIESENWGYLTETDEMTSKNAYSAVVTSSNLQEFDFPYNGGASGYLTLRKHPRYGKDVIFSVDKGQVLCHSYGDCSITLRFDKKPPITLAGNPPEDNSSTHVFLPYQRLFKSIKNSKTMRIEANFYQEGSRSFEFDTSKLSWSS